MIPTFVEKSGGDNGEFVRFDGHRCQVIKTTFGKREYLRLTDGTSFTLDRADQVLMANLGRLTTDASWNKLAETYADILDRDWSPECFTDAEMESAYYRQTFLLVLDRNDAKARRKMTVIKAVIAEVKAANPDIKIPSVEAVRKWDERWLVSGRDIRVLANRDAHRGNHGPDPRFAWIDEIIEDGIDKYLLQSPYWEVKELFKHLQPIVRAKMDENNPVRSNVQENAYFGKNRIYTLLARRNQAEQKVKEVGRKEARRSTKGQAAGPSGDCALHEVEMDHHMLDIDVTDADGNVLGRPWITVMIDRWSRMILGFYITLEPPSWFSVMMCVRVAVMPKADYLASFPYEFTREWDCFGSPDFLFLDRAAEFRGRSLKATASVLNIIPVDIPRARGDLKGKVENWFDKYERQIGKLPGHKGSRPDKRIEETAVARLTMEEVNLVSAVYIVDIYNYERHGITREKPAERFKKSLEDGLILKLPPPIELLGPATSVAKEPTLTEKGIKFDNLRYNSDALTKHWFKVGNRKVFARPDEDDVRICWVHDGAKKWIKATLQGKYSEIRMTRSEMAKRLKRDKAAEIDSPEEHEKDMRARANYGDLIDQLAPRSNKPKPLTRQTKASTHLNKPRVDPDASAAPITGYSADNPVPTNQFDGMGPFEKPSSTQKALEGKTIEVGTDHYADVTSPKLNSNQEISAPPSNAPVESAPGSVNEKASNEATYAPLKSGRMF